MKTTKQLIRDGIKERNRQSSLKPLAIYQRDQNMQQDEQDWLEERIGRQVMDIKSRNQCRYVIKTFMREFKMSRKKARQLVFCCAANPVHELGTDRREANRL